MATWDDVRRIALALPATTEATSYGKMAWSVQNKSMCWERPLRPADLAALGESVPDGPVLAAQVPDLGVKDALIAEDPQVYFTTPHFTGYKAILVQLERISLPDLEELIVESWLARAPKRLVTAFLAARD